MSSKKREVIEKLSSKNLDPLKLEKELINMLRNGKGAYEIRSYLKHLLEGEKT
ncbi:MAG: hypothetical protein LM588_03100 [Fervidicoccaceae archaeon]|nr:hypothetical protein [Fervidicoccaceae archaeon]